MYVDTEVVVTDDSKEFKGKLQCAFGTTGKVKVLFDENL